MKLHIVVVLLLSFVSYSQNENLPIQFEKNDKILYLDSSFVKTSEDKHQFYRIIKDFALDKKPYSVYEFNKAGVLLMKGFTNSKEGLPLIGMRIFYYENGKKKSATNYKKGRPIGKETQWYSDGTKKLESEYIEDENTHLIQQRIDQFWDTKGEQTVVNGNGFIEDHDVKESSKGEVKNGHKEGRWEGSFDKSKYTYIETYKNGELSSGISTHIDGKTYKYTALEIKAEPKNGIKDLYEFISYNYKAPKVLDDFKGKVFISFVVNKEGEIVEPVILKDVGYGTGEEAIRVLSLYTKFKPAEQRGIKVNCKFSIPITILSRI